MASVPLHPKSLGQHESSQLLNPLPQLLHTPAGFALLELQGTINLPTHEELDSESAAVDQENSKINIQETPIGRLIFPDYNPEAQDSSSTAWMKRVYLYVGKHQRLTGEVKKLPKAIAVIRKRRAEDINNSNGVNSDLGDERTEELEIVEIVKWKILFSQRPEPVGTWTGVA